MTARVHEFEPREGGRFRSSLTYDGSGDVGKSAARMDTYAVNHEDNETGMRMALANLARLVEGETPSR